MKLRIAISGKGGAGKSTLSVLLAREFAKEDKVLLIDADPVPTTAKLLGVSHEITPLVKMTELIEERTGVDESRKFFNLNPEVGDIVDKIGIDCGDNLKLLVLGTLGTVKSGCFCPENAFLKAFLRHLTKQDGILLLDMEAGVEHLTRGTTQNVDLLLVVTEPTRRAMEVVRAIKAQAENAGIGKEKMLAVINKVRGEEEVQVTKGILDELVIKSIATIPHDESIVASELKGAPLEGSPSTVREIERLAHSIKGFSSEKS